MIAEPKTTPLEQALRGLNDKPSPTTAFEQAKAWFDAGQRLDMVQLAEALGVSRATLYRWVGSREALLTEVIWAGAQDLMKEAEANAKGTGGDYIAQVMSLFIELVVRNAAMNAFLDREGESAMRLLTKADCGFQPRFVAWAKGLIDVQANANRMTLTLPSDELAFAVIRMGESYIYRRFITGDRPDLRTVPSLMKLLLR